MALGTNNCSLIVVMETSNLFRPLRQPMVIRRPFAWGRRQDGVNAFVVDPLGS
jgi:hypothetical protein